MSSWVNRTALSGSSVNRNGTSSHTCTFTPATSGNLLIAVVAGGVTFTTPSGWTLVQSAVNLGTVYVFSKTASSGESSFATTHNGSNYPIEGIVYEFYAGSTTIGTPGTAIGTGQGGPYNGPACTSLSGTYTRFSARVWNLGSSGVQAGSCAWTTPSTEDYELYETTVGPDNILLSVAYDDGATGSSFTPSSTVTASTGSSGEGVSFAVSVVPPPSSSWVNRTVLSGSSVSQNGTNSHTCTFTPATSGNFLVAIVAGGVTFTTPSGWTLARSVVNNGGLYVFTKTASSGESSFSTTHNGTNYPIKGVVYEFYAGTSVYGTPASTSGQAADGTTVTGPSQSSIVGTYTGFAIRGLNVGAGGLPAASCTWTTPSIEDYDSLTPGDGTVVGIELAIAYNDGLTSSTFNPSSVMSCNVGFASSEAITFALSIGGSPATIPAPWITA